MNGRALRQWGQLGLHVTLMVTGLVLVQIVAERTNHRIDLTVGRELSLSSVSEQVLREIVAPVHVTAFYRRGTRAQYAPLLERLRAVNAQVDYELLDLDRYPERARTLGVTQYGSAAVESQGRRVVVAALPEADIVGGILSVVRGHARRLVFTTGHGERSPSSREDGYGRFVAALEVENRHAASVSLTAEAIPDGTDGVIVGGPRHDFLPGEVARLATYLRGGGSVLLLLEPGPLPNLTALLTSLGIRLSDDFLVDRERSVIGTDGLAVIVELFKRGNPISEPGGIVLETGVVLPSARSVDVTSETPGVTAEAIARTAPSAWAMLGPERARRGDAPSAEAHDVPGGASVMVMAEIGPPGDDARRGRLVVVGDADFASDAYIDLLGNRDLALNAVAWLTQEPALAGTRPTRANEVFRPLSPLVLSESQARSLLVGLAVLQPGLVLIAGIVVVGLRRRRG